MSSIDVFLLEPVENGIRIYLGQHFRRSYYQIRCDIPENAKQVFNVSSYYHNLLIHVHLIVSDTVKLHIYYYRHTAKLTIPYSLFYIDYLNDMIISAVFVMRVVNNVRVFIFLKRFFNGGSTIATM